MSPKSLLAASLFVLLSAVPLHGQTDHVSADSQKVAGASAAPARASGDALVRVPELSRATIASLDAPARPDPRMLLRSKARPQAQEQAGGCYTLREKRFRMEGSRTDGPVPYESATCTPAGDVHTKSAVVSNAK